MQQQPEELFSFFEKAEDVPLFKGMECYFPTPLVGSFCEHLGFYYIINYSVKEKAYKLSIYDEEISSMMNGGARVNIGESVEYQADEYHFSEEDELYKTLYDCHFGFKAVEQAKTGIQKLMKGVTNGK